MKRKFIAAVATLLAAVLCLSACGGNGGDGATETGETQEQEVSWQDSHVPLGILYESATVKDGIIYGYYEDEDGSHVSAQEMKTQEVMWIIDLEEITGASGITVDAEGTIYLIEPSVYDELTRSYTDDRIWKIDMQGETEVINIRDDIGWERLDRFDITDLYIDEEGNFYLCCKLTVEFQEFDDYLMEVEGNDIIESCEREAEREGWDDQYKEEELQHFINVTCIDVERVYVKDSEFNTLFYKQVRDSKFISFFLNEDDNGVFLARDNDGVFTWELSAEQQDVVAEERLDEFAVTDVDGPMTFSEDGFLYCKGNEVYRYYYDSQEQELVLNLSSYGILAEDILYFGYEDGSIQVLDNYSGGDETEYTEFTLGVDSRETVTLGVMMETDEIEQLVAGFNRYSGDVRVEIVVYGDGQDMETDLEQLKMDLVSGDAPDVIDVSEINTSMYAGKGAFLDLYELMDEDGDFDRDTLVGSVLEACSTDGSLYSIGYAFQLYSIWGAKQTVQGRSGVGVDELVGLLAENGKDANAIYGVSADEPFLTMLFAFSMDSFIDWETAECCLSADYMGTLLELAAGYENGYTGTGAAAGIASGDILLTVGIIDSVAAYQIQDELYGSISFLGYPTESGSGTAASFRGSEFAINAACGNRTAAWEFVKYCVENGYDGGGFPLLAEQLEETFAEAMTPEITVDEDGEEEVLPKDSLYDGTGGYLFVYEADESDVEAVRKLIESADTRHQYNTQIQEIIDDEADAYFSGQSSLESTVERIQERVTLYLQEQM